jgi:uncharacterized protein involved in exopolysaccharide biosynthesis
MAERVLRDAALSAHGEADRLQQNSPSNEVDLQPYLAIVWAYRVFIVAVALCFGAGAFLLAIRSTRLYEATTVLSVSQSKLTDNSGTLATANFRPIVTNRGVAQKILREFGLDGAPYYYTPARFLEEAVQLEEVKNSGLMRLGVRLQRPDLAAGVANKLAAGAVEFSQTLNQDEAVRLRDLIKSQLDVSDARMKRAAQALLAFKRTAQIDLVRIDVEAILDQRKEILGLLVDVEGGRAKVASAEAELAKLQRVDVTTKTVLGDPTMLEASRPLMPQGTSPLGLQVKTEDVSPEYQALAKELAFSRMDLAEAEKRKQQLVDRMHLDAQQLGLVRDLQDKDAELTRLQMDYAIAEKAYTDVASRYEGARLQVAGHSAELQIIDPALPPERPLSRQVVLRTFSGAAIGLVLGAVVALISGLARRSSQTA